MPDVGNGRYLVQAGWDDVPHLAPQVKADLLRSTPPYLRKARSTGAPSLGAGAIYPIDEADLLVDPFAIPDWWPRGFGLDVGWNRTAAVWGAQDRENDTLYLYAEHYRGQVEPAIHAAGIKARGAWVPGFVDPAARGRSQSDGKRLIDTYRSLGLNLLPADNAVEAGLLAVHDRLSTGRLKVFRTLANWRKEHQLYRRDENGKIVKANDHIMDATRYLVMTGITRLLTRPAVTEPTPSVAIADATAGY